MAGIAVSSSDAPNVDEVGLYQALYNAFVNAQECDKYDVKPNEKGKIAPKFHKKNQDRLNNRRLDLINAGVFYQDKEDKEAQFKFLDLFVETAEQSLFGDAPKGLAEENLGNIAFYSAYNALLNKEYQKAERYAKYSLNDSVQSENAYAVMLDAMQKQLSTKQDSLAYAQKLENMYRENPNKNVIFETLCGVYSTMDNKPKLLSLISERLAQNPTDWAALAYRGQIAQTEKRFDDAIADFTKASASQPENVFLASALGICYLEKARELEMNEQDENNRISTDTESKRNELLKVAVKHFEDARRLDKNMDFRHNWAYNLYNCYYVLYGEDDARTKELEALQK
jgi:predicted Zn-dependent protease